MGVLSVEAGEVEVVPDVRMQLLQCVVLLLVAALFVPALRTQGLGFRSFIYLFEGFMG